LTNKLLLNPKYFTLGNLIRLDLRNCSQVTEGIIKPIADEALSLEVLNLSGCSKIKSISNYGFFVLEVVTFPSLRKIEHIKL